MRGPPSPIPRTLSCGSGAVAQPMSYRQGLRAGGGIRGREDFRRQDADFPALAQIHADRGRTGNRMLSPAIGEGEAVRRAHGPRSRGAPGRDRTENSNVSPDYWVSSSMVYP